MLIKWSSFQKSVSKFTQKTFYEITPQVEHYTVLNYVAKQTL